jgi:hypothetical protein
MICELGWEGSGYDRVAYSKMWDDDMRALVGFWVNSATIVGSEVLVLELEKSFQDQFRISGSGEAHWILRTSIRCDAKLQYIYMSQDNYIDNVACKFNVHQGRPVYAPLPLSVNFSTIAHPETDDEQSEAAKLPYKELIGSLMFVAIATRLDVAYVVNKLVQYSSNPSHGHWNLVK